MGFIPGREAVPHNEDIARSHASDHGASHGGLFATLLSAVALLFSGFSYYETSLKTASLDVFVPPMIHYARDGDNDVFNVPITISNDGARTGIVLNMELLVENLRPDAARKSAKFHSAFVGEWPRGENAQLKSFAPISIGGNGNFTETIRFYPMDEPLPFVVDDKGDYRFTLSLLTAESPDPDIIERMMATKPKPLTFELKLPFISFQHLSFRRGTIAMFNKDWKPAVSINTGPAVSQKATPEPAEPAAPEAAPSEPAPEEAPASPAQ
jgi:hypothetical protein